MRLNEREIHGGTVMAGSTDKPLTLFEQDDKILVRKGYDDFTLSAADARIFARKLNRLALRIEKRAASVDTHPEGGDAVAAPFMGSAVASAQADDRRPTINETSRGADVSNKASANNHGD